MPHAVTLAKLVSQAVHFPTDNNNTRMNLIASHRVCYENFCAQLSVKAWLCICVGMEPPFFKSWIRQWKSYTQVYLLHVGKCMCITQEHGNLLLVHTQWSIVGTLCFCIDISDTFQHYTNDNLTWHSNITNSRTTTRTFLPQFESYQFLGIIVPFYCYSTRLS